MHLTGQLEVGQALPAVACLTLRCPWHFAVLLGMFAFSLGRLSVIITAPPPDTDAARVWAQIANCSMACRASHLAPHLSEVTQTAVSRAAGMPQNAMAPLGLSSVSF